MDLSEAVVVNARMVESPQVAGVALSSLARGVAATVVEVLTPNIDEDRDLVLRLIEIGFVAGERVRVVARGFPGGDPLAVRIGGTTFALRRFEADYVRVVADDATSCGIRGQA
jgi:ferrous iron transport protein A